MSNIVAKLDGVERSDGSGKIYHDTKFAIRFIGIRDEEWISWTTRSCFCFTSEADALAAGERALVILNETGAFPNMCEPF